jgi:3,4-dihydroxy 2-butanone 4-phosphate synthase/GTP cyclohydrolase II
MKGKHEMKNNLTVKRLVKTRIPTAYGDFDLVLYSNSQDNKEHLALVKGDPGSTNSPLVRLHSECFTGDVIGSLRCDCGEQLDLAMQKIAEESVGAILYLRQEGRGIGLLDKLHAYNLQDDGYDTVDANVVLGHDPDERDYSVGAQILGDLGIGTIRLMTNNPEKIQALIRLGIDVVERVPLQPNAHPENTHYLLTKAHRMDHMLNLSPLLEGVKGNSNGNVSAYIQGSNGNGH